MFDKTRRRVCLMLAVMLCAFALGGCESDGGAAEAQGVILERSIGAQAHTTPMQKPGGGKFRVGLVDTDEYEPASTYFYHVLMGLKNLGWITYDELPFTQEDLFDTASIDVQKMMRYLDSMNLGDYVEFVGDAAYLINYDGEAETEQGLRGHIASEAGLDLVLAMGTAPGQFLGPLNLDVPVLVCMSTDPVAAGIVGASDYSGDSGVWAQVEPSPYYRQIKFYYNTIPFTNVGMVYNDPVIAGIPDYERGARELGVKITGAQIEKPDDADAAAYTEQLLSVYRRMIAADGIDAYILNADLYTSAMPTEELLRPFVEAGIPVFVQDGENYVRDGAMMLVASTDNQGVGQFVAQTMAQVFRGENAGGLLQEYVSSPYMSLNLDTAKSIGFQPSFAMLLSCESIYPREDVVSGR